MRGEIGGVVGVVRGGKGEGERELGGRESDGNGRCCMVGWTDSTGRPGGPNQSY